MSAFSYLNHSVFHPDLDEGSESPPLGRRSPIISSSPAEGSELEQLYLNKKSVGGGKDSIKYFVFFSFLVVILADSR